MKQMLYILTFLSFQIGSTVYGQTTSNMIDSLTKSILKNKVNSYEDIYAFKYIIDQRQENNLKTHLDTTKGDYIFIKEYFFSQDSSATSKEEYFNTGDSIPTVIYLSDSLYDVEKLYTSFFGRESKRINEEELFTPKIKNLKSYKTYQELAYNKIQTRSHGCVDFDREGEKFKERRTEQLKGTYAIYTLIDNQTDKVWISLQYPPKKPKFIIDRYNPVWDF
jgi:hypothetical protein